VRVAALCDIHGNLPALEAVLADVESVRADVVVCVGDLVGGPFSSESFDRMAGPHDVRFVRGNADRTVVEGTDEHGVDWNEERARLGDARLAEIASWPLTRELDVDGLGRTLFCHAVPSSDDPIFTRITPDEDVLDLIGEVEADVLVCGHTHVQFDRRLPNGLRVVNAGSVGMPYEGRRGAFWTSLGPGVDLRCTSYDTEAAVATILERPGPDNDALARRLLEPPDPQAATEFFESLRGA
jgi:predicted phosphodiesterase